MGPRWLQALDNWLGRVPGWLAFACALIASALVGAADFYSRPDLIILYLGPVFIASWYAGRIPGFTVSIFSCFLVYMRQKITGNVAGFDSQAAQDALVRLIVYVLLSHTFARLKQARREQEELVGYIVHDLRSPIANTISGLMTLEQTAENLTDSDQEMVELALLSSQRALRLVTSLLDVAKIQNGKMQVHPQSVDIKNFLDECLVQTALWAKSSEIEQVPETTVVSAVFDPELTSRVITNLVSNALRFSPRGTKIHVRVEADPRGILFSVVDQGPGIPTDQVESIFEPFAQVKGTKAGTGLGLTFCRLAVQSQRGEMGIESQMGEGSTFWFVLPNLS